MSETDEHKQPGNERHAHKGALRRLVRGLIMVAALVGMLAVVIVPLAVLADPWGSIYAGVVAALCLAWILGELPYRG